MFGIGKDKYSALPDHMLSTEDQDRRAMRRAGVRGIGNRALFLADRQDARRMSRRLAEIEHAQDHKDQAKIEWEKGRPAREERYQEDYKARDQVIRDRIERENPKDPEIRHGVVTNPLHPDYDSATHIQLMNDMHLARNVRDLSLLSNPEQAERIRQLQEAISAEEAQHRLDMNILPPTGWPPDVV